MSPDEFERICDIAKNPHLLQKKIRLKDNQQAGEEGRPSVWGLE